MRVLVSSYLIKYDTYHQTTGRASCDVFTITHVVYVDFEAVATGTWVMVELQRFIVFAVLDFDLIIEIQLLVCHDFGE